MKINNMKTISLKRKAAFCILCLLTALWMTVIFGFSSAESKESTKHSSGITENVIKTIAPDYEEMPTYKSTHIQKTVVTAVRKSAHIFSYALLGVLTYLACGVLVWLPGRIVKPAFISVPFCILYGISDEIHQVYVPGRHGSVVDVVIDTAGILLGTVLAALAVLMMLKITNNLQKRER